MKKESFWGDESAAVERALAWARLHTASGSNPKTTARPAEELYQEIGNTITEEGLGSEKAMEIYDKVLNPATRSSDDPMNFAHIPGAPTRAAIAFDEVVSAANVFGGLWEVGAGGIFAENQVLAFLASKLGWPESARGTFVSGGTLGNLAALACARHAAKLNWGQQAMGQEGRPTSGFKLAIAETAHSSIRTIAQVLDVDVVTVPVNEKGQLTGQAVKEALAENKGVFAVVCTSGTTNAGIIDDIQGVVKAAHDQNVWVHVDGAYGGAGILADSVRPLYAGIEEVDSFIVDPHKWLFAPYDCCAVLYRNPRPAYQTFSQHAEYLDLIDHAVSNPSDLAIHLSRRTRGLPLWYSLVTHGTKKYSQAIERGLENARTFAEAVKKSDHLKLIFEPTLSIVLFYRPGWTDAQYNEWSNRLAKAGELLCIPTRHAGETVLRMAFMNPDTDVEKVIEIMEESTR